MSPLSVVQVIACSLLMETTTLWLLALWELLAQHDLPTCVSEGENLQGKPVHGYPDHDRMLGRFLGRA